MITILAQADDAASGGSAWTLLIFAVLIGVFFYFVMIRPQRTRMRRHQELVSTLEVGDEVTTIGGIYGRIEFMDEEAVVIQVEGGGRLRMMRRAIAGKVDR